MAFRHSRFHSDHRVVVAELERLRRENVELERANEIAKSAADFFAVELHRRTPGDRLHPRYEWLAVEITNVTKDNSEVYRARMAR